MSLFEKPTAKEVFDMAKKLNDEKKKYFKYKIFGVLVKKPHLTSTFWLCFSIILVGLLFCGTYYIVNKDTGRYEYDSGLIIDKKTGDAKQINLK